MDTLLYNRIHIKPYKHYTIITDNISKSFNVVITTELPTKFEVFITGTKKEFVIYRTEIIKNNSIHNEFHDNTYIKDHELFAPVTVKSEQQLRALCKRFTLSSKGLRMIYLQGPSEYVKPEYKLTRLRKYIKERCPELHLRVDYGYKLEIDKYDIGSNSDLSSVIACLFYNKTIVSMIECYPHSIKSMTELEISSHTEDTYKNNKYNILLRSIVIILGRNIFNSDEIVSRAISPISVWIMWKYFQAEFDSDFTHFMKSNQTLTLELIKEYFTTKRRVKCKISLTDENIEIAWKVFYYLTDTDSKLKCP